MSRKFTPHIELEATAYSHAPADLIIRNEFDKYLDVRREKQSRSRKNLIYAAAVILLISAAVMIYPILSDFISDKYAYFKSGDMESTLQVFSYEIKASALKKYTPPAYAAYNFSQDSSLSDHSGYAWLIHMYNNDYYGRQLKLSSLTEKRLYAYAAYSGFNDQDLFGFDRPFTGDSDQSVREWLMGLALEKNLHSPYYNPRIAELRDQIEYCSAELNKELTEPFSRDQLVSLRMRSLMSDLSPDNSQDVILKTLEFIKEDPTLLERLFHLENTIRRDRDELDIRLALMSMYLASDHKFRGNQQLFAWLSADMTGASMIKSGQALKNRRDLFKELNDNYTDYYRHYTETQKLYDQINLEYYDYRIENPIRIGLTVKDVGLFGVRRRTEGGYIYEHKGIDLMAEKGTAVYPVREGYVTKVESDSDGHGNHVVIWHDNDMTTTYSHLDHDRYFEDLQKNFDSSGPFWVGLSSRLGSVGTSGNIPKGDPQYGYAHLHLEITDSRTHLNPFLMINDNITVIH